MCIYIDALKLANPDIKLLHIMRSSHSTILILSHILKLVVITSAHMYFEIMTDDMGEFRLCRFRRTGLGTGVLWPGILVLCLCIFILKVMSEPGQWSLTTRPRETRSTYATYYDAMELV